MPKPRIYARDALSQDFPRNPATDDYDKWITKIERWAVLYEQDRLIIHEAHRVIGHAYLNSEQGSDTEKETLNWIQLHGGDPSMAIQKQKRLSEITEQVESATVDLEQRIEGLKDGMHRADIVIQEAAYKLSVGEADEAFQILTGAVELAQDPMPAWCGDFLLWVREMEEKANGRDHG